MDAHFIDQVFSDLNPSKDPLPYGEYDGCTFKDCDFSSAHFINFLFIDCTFIHCNLSNAHIGGCLFRDVSFRNCKMLGLRFDTCKDVGMVLKFEDCVLNHSSFFQKKLKKTPFVNTQLKGVDFTDTDLTESVFKDCDLSEAKFDHTILVKVDFTKAAHYVIDPELNSIKKAKFSIPEVIGLLAKYDIDIRP